jgi:hypothetical protein
LQLRRSEICHAAKTDELATVVGRQRELQRDLTGALTELNRLKMELRLLRPLQPQGRPGPQSAARQETHPELEPPYSPHYHRPPPQPRPAAQASPALAWAIAHGKQIHQAHHTGSPRVPPPKAQPASHRRPVSARASEHNPFVPSRLLQTADATGHPGRPRVLAAPIPSWLTCPAGGSRSAAGGDRQRSGSEGGSSGGRRPRSWLAAEQHRS